MVTVPTEGLCGSRSRAGPLRGGAAGRTPGGVPGRVRAPVPARVVPLGPAVRAGLPSLAPAVRRHVQQGEGPAGRLGAAATLRRSRAVTDWRLPGRRSRLATKCLDQGGRPIRTGKANDPAHPTRCDGPRMCAIQRPHRGPLGEGRRGVRRELARSGRSCPRVGGGGGFRRQLRAHRCPVRPAVRWLHVGGCPAGFRGRRGNRGSGVRPGRQGRWPGTGISVSPSASAGATSAPVGARNTASRVHSQEP